MTPEHRITCEEALRFLAAFIDGELKPARHEEVQRHLSHCRSCWSRAEFERRLKARIGELSHELVPTELEERIARLLADLVPQRS
jgi:anti-sigma factor (TIGR02949 family)